MKLWTKASVDKQIEAFTIGDDADLDMMMAGYDVRGSLAHVQMLSEVGLISQEDYTLLQKALNEILEEIEAGNFKIEEGVEDIHSQVELLVTQRYGEVAQSTNQ